MISHVCCPGWLPIKIYNKYNLNYNKNTIKLFYYNQVNFNYIKDKKSNKTIIHRYISPIDNKNYLRFIIYYKKIKN